MNALLAVVPILAAAVAMVRGRGAMKAAVLGCVAAAVLVAVRFRVPSDQLWGSWVAYAPTVLEVLLILLFGMVLAGLLRATRAMETIGEWVLATSPSAPAGAALVVFGLVPFAESVTGFGIGVTVGVPILAAMGYPPARAALLGLLGLTAVPWGALGPGTSVAARLGGVDFTALGIATARVNGVAILVVAIAVALLADSSPSDASSAPRRLPSVSAVVHTGLGATALWAGILAANTVFGTPIAGVLGSTFAVVALLVSFSVGGRLPRADRRLGRALLPYAVLTGGLVVAQTLAVLVPSGTVLGGVDLSGMAHAVALPPVWLAVSTAVAAWQLRGTTSSGGSVPVMRTGVRAWVPVGVTTGLFMVLGWLMTASGMSAAIGDALGAVGPAVVPGMAGVGAVLTGSNTGSNAMFASAISAMTVTGGAGPTFLLALGNSAGSLGTMATPSRVTMAVTLATQGAADAQERAALERQVMGRSLGIVGCAVVVLALVAVAA